MPKKYGYHCSKLYYIHGYQSSPEGTKGVLFQKELHTLPIKYRDVPPEELVIKDCLARISDIIHDQDDVVLIGSSLGGFLAAVTAVNHENVSRLILLNPAIMPPEIDISRINSMPQRILKDMVCPRLLRKKFPGKVIIFRGTKDDVVPDEWVLEYAKTQEATVHFIADDHRLNNSLRMLIDKIKNYL